MKNKYIKSSHISESKFRQLLKCFSQELTASQTAALTSLNRKTVDRIYLLLRIRIAQHCQDESPFKGDLEVDESYFGPRRVTGKRGRDAGSKTIVFGLLKRKGKVYTQIVPDCKKTTLQAIIRGKADISSVIHSDGWPGYDGLVDVGYEKHYRVNHSENEFSKGNGIHVNGIESFWAFAKHRLVKFKGIPDNKFTLHLKETEFRFNYRNEVLYKFLLKNLKSCPL